jgi:hypothetical protein
MGKLVLNPSPSFSVKVAIPVHGSVTSEVEFTFKHRTRDQFGEWLKALDGKDKDVAIMEMATAWDLEDAFSAESVSKLLDNYMGAFDAIYSAYIEELTQAKLKN